MLIPKEPLQDRPQKTFLRLPNETEPSRISTDKKVCRSESPPLWGAPR